MPRQVKVEIEGNHIPNVLHVEYGLDVSRDTNGAPVDADPRLKTITIVRRSDDNTDLWRWSLHPHQGNFKSGKIVFKDPVQEDQDLITVEWKNGFVRRYSENLPHIHHNKREPLTEMVEVSAQTITINGVEWEANFKDWV